MQIQYFRHWVILLPIRWAQLLVNYIRAQDSKPRKKPFPNKLIRLWQVLLLPDKWVVYTMTILRNKEKSWVHYRQASTSPKSSFTLKIFFNISNSTTKWWRRRNWRGGKRSFENSKGFQILSGSSHCTEKNRRLILRNSFKRCFSGRKIITIKFCFSD